MSPFQSRACDNVDIQRRTVRVDPVVEYTRRIVIAQERVESLQ